MSPRDTTLREEGLRELHQTVSQLAEQSRTLVSSLDFARAFNRVSVLDLARALDRTHNVDRALDLDLDLVSVLDLGRAIVRVRACVRALVRALVRAIDSPSASGSARARARARVRAYELSGLLESMERRLAVMVGESGPGVDERSGSSGLVDVKPGRAAVQLNWWAVRMLPEAARARYAEELLDELYVLAEDGAGRWRQLACGLRQALLGSWQIRAALRQERRPSPAPGQGR